jgi:hypothetical protein
MTAGALGRRPDRHRRRRDRRARLRRRRPAPLARQLVAALQVAARSMRSAGQTAVTGIVFHSSVSDSGVHLVAWIMTGVSLALLITLLDRTLSRRPN